MSDILLHFVHISDTHISHDPSYQQAELQRSPLPTAQALVEKLNNLSFEPAFVLHTGDVVYNPDEEAYEYAREILGRIRWPVHYVPGNHDSAEMLQRVFLQRSEIQPTWHYSFEVNGVQVIGLEDRKSVV